MTNVNKKRERGTVRERGREKSFGREIHFSFLCSDLLLSEIPLGEWSLKCY